MQRAGTLNFGAVCWVFCSLFLAGSAVAQEQYDCASFGSQESAQAELDRDPSDPSNLDADDDGQACETYDYGAGSGGGGGGDDGELDCADFATQEEAQAEYKKDTSDPYRLDADNDGKACETYPYDGDGGEGSADPNPEGTTPEGTSETGTPAGDQYEKKVPPSDVNNPKDVIPGTSAKKIPNTGGPPYFAVGALALLGAASIAGLGVLRR